VTNAEAQFGLHVVPCRSASKTTHCRSSARR